jgi:hypothetical protein
MFIKSEKEIVMNGWSVEEWLKARFPQAWRREVRRREMMAFLMALPVGIYLFGMFVGWW